MSPLEDLLLQFYASVADREKGAAFIDQNPAYFQELFTLACAPDQKRTHIVAAWVLEKYTFDKLALLSPVFREFLTGVALQKHESKRRPMIKLLFYYCKDKKRRERAYLAARYQHQVMLDSNPARKYLEGKQSIYGSSRF